MIPYTAYYSSQEPLDPAVQDDGPFVVIDYSGYYPISTYSTLANALGEPSVHYPIPSVDEHELPIADSNDIGDFLDLDEPQILDVLSESSNCQSGCSERPVDTDADLLVEDEVEDVPTTPLGGQSKLRPTEASTPKQMKKNADARYVVIPHPYLPFIDLMLKPKAHPDRP
jgi:hypothetical protein